MTRLQEWNKKIIYKDIFSLYSYDWIEDEGGSMYQKQHDNPAIIGAPCYLSISKYALGGSHRLDQPKTARDDRSSVERVFTVFCDPKYLIKAGDILRINHAGLTIDVTAGEPHRYSCYQEMLVYSLLDA